MAMSTLPQNATLSNIVRLNVLDKASVAKIENQV
jgi:hypothetical protein